MKNRQYSILEILLIESLFFLAFFGFLKFMNLGNPRLFSTLALVLIIGFCYFGIARYIDTMKKEESGTLKAL